MVDTLRNLKHFVLGFVKNKKCKITKNTFRWNQFTFPLKYFRKYLLVKKSFLFCFIFKATYFESLH